MATPMKQPAPWPESLETQSFLDRLPSWIVSIALHGLVAFVFLLNLRSCELFPHEQTNEEMVGGDEFVEVGIHTEPPNPSPSSEDIDTAPVNEASSNPQPQEDPLSDVPPTEDLPPVDLPLPDKSRPVLGQGSGAPRSLAPQDIGELIQPRGPARATSTTGVGATKAKFMGVMVEGATFLYVIDCSGSMIGRPMNYAKTELLASLERLERNQRFGIIFYNDTYKNKVFAVSGNDAGVYWANAINRNFAKRFIARIQPDSGTLHKEPLLAAVRMKPDVIFFLTDAKEPALSAGELDQIARTNNGQSRIFCIEFGKGRELEDFDNFLKILAKQNNGQYRYRNVSTLGR